MPRSLLAALQCRPGRGAYTRYADDLTFSFAEDVPGQVGWMISAARRVLDENGYRIHLDKKLQVRRQHQQQRVTGLVVNEAINLPRRTRRWLRAVEHRARTGGRPTLTEAQRQGWATLVSMVEKQRKLPDEPS